MIPQSKLLGLQYVNTFSVFFDSLKYSDFEYSVRRIDHRYRSSWLYLINLEILKQKNAVVEPTVPSEKEKQALREMEQLFKEAVVAVEKYVFYVLNF